jgi:hypothetical protein
LLEAPEALEEGADEVETAEEGVPDFEELAVPDWVVPVVAAAAVPEAEPLPPGAAVLSSHAERMHN